MDEVCVFLRLASENGVCAVFDVSNSTSLSTIAEGVARLQRPAVFDQRSRQRNLCLSTSLIEPPKTIRKVVFVVFFERNRYAKRVNCLEYISPPDENNAHILQKPNRQPVNPFGRLMIVLVLELFFSPPSAAWTDVQLSMSFDQCSFPYPRLRCLARVADAEIDQR